MSRSSTPDEDIEKYLTEAGVNDATLSKQELLELYKVVKQSKTTATQEDEQRKILQQTNDNCLAIKELLHKEISNDSDEVNVETKTLQEQSSVKNIFSPKVWSSLTSKVRDVTKLQESESNGVHKEIKMSDTQLQEHKRSEIEDALNAMCCKPSKYEPIKCEKQESYYAMPFYCNPELKKLSRDERARMIYNYHLTMLRQYREYQRNSIFPAPWPKPVQTNIRFNGSLTRVKEISVEETEDKETSVSNKKEDDIPETDQKATEKVDASLDDEDFVSPPQTRLTSKRKLYSAFSDTEKDANKKFMAATENKVPIRRKNLTPLKNAEIMQRSKLFQDSPGYSDKIFSKLPEIEEEKKIKEKEMELFNAELMNSSDEDDKLIIQEDNSEPEPDDEKDVSYKEPVIRRRVTPPPYSKNGRNTKRRQQNDSVSDENITEQKKPANKRNTRQKPIKQSDEPPQWITKRTTTLDVVKSPQTRKTNVIKRSTCPICNGSFPIEELEKHAATCGEENHSHGDVKTMTCEVCDQVFLANTDFEVHVQRCVSERLRNQM